jgi:hypothetical protein
VPTLEQQMFGDPGKHGVQGFGQTRALAQSTSPAAIAAAERRYKATRARAEGKSWEQVQKEAGYRTRPAAIAGVKRYLDELRKETLSNAEELRQMEVGRLDMALVSITEIAFDQYMAPDRRLAALEALRRNVETRSKLLNLFPSEKLEVITVGAIEQRVAELSHKLGMELPAELTQYPDDEDETDDGFGD